MTPTDDRIKEICALELKASTPTDPALFDRTNGQLAAAGLSIDHDATAAARLQSPNLIAVYKWWPEGYEHEAPDLVSIELIDGEADINGYDGELSTSVLTPEKIKQYYDDPPITPADLAGLRYIEREGVRLYAENDIDSIHAGKIEAARIRREAMRNVSLVLPDEFLDLCEEVKQEPADVLRGFIADLCGLNAAPYIDHGSDERDMAEAYFDRCGYRWWAKEEGEGGNDKG